MTATKESENWTVICDCELSKDGFWSGLRVWIERPHILNKRINVMDSVSTVNVGSLTSLNDVENFTWKTLSYKLRNLSLNMMLSKDQAGLSRIFRQSLKSLGVIETESLGGAESLSIILRHHIPKNKTRHYEMYELVVKGIETIFIVRGCTTTLMRFHATYSFADVLNSTAVFIPYLRPDQLLNPVISPITYAFHYDDANSKWELFKFHYC